MKKIFLFLLLIPSIVFAQLELPFPVKVVNPKPLDFWYYESDGTPYDNTTEAITQVISAVRYRGLTVNVNGVEYWWKDGSADIDLVLKGGSTAWVDITGKPNFFPADTTLYWKTGGTSNLTDNVRIYGKRYIDLGGFYDSQRLQGFYSAVQDSTNTERKGSFYFSGGYYTLEATDTITGEYSKIETNIGSANTATSLWHEYSGTTSRIRLLRDSVSLESETSNVDRARIILKPNGGAGAMSVFLGGQDYLRMTPTLSKFYNDLEVPDEAYDATAWNGSLEVPTKNAIRDKIETMGGGGSGTVNSGTQYRLGYYATTGAAISEAAAITANRALISDANGVPTHSATTATELGYSSGVTSSIQTQLNAKAPTASPTFTGTPVFPASVTIAANAFTRAGAHDLTLTTTGTTNVTLPTSGTLAISSAAQTFTGTQTFSPTATVAGINLGSYAGNPSSMNNYDVWFNSSLPAFGIKMAATNYYVPHIATADAVSGRISFVASSSGRNSTNANLLYNGTQVNVPSLVIGSTGSIPANTSLYVPSSTNPVVLNGQVIKRTADSGSDLYRREQEFPLSTGSGSTGNTDYNLFLSDAITNSTVTVEVTITAVSSDGVKSYAKKMYATFRKPGTSDMVQVGSTVDVYEHSNDLTSPVSSLSVSSDNMRVAWDSGTGAPTLQWTHKIKIIQTTW